jgi:hypothetical protein
LASGFQAGFLEDHIGRQTDELEKLVTEIENQIAS